MKDKIFVTFLCATLCVVTNAMGAVGDGVGTCVLQAKTRPEWEDGAWYGRVGAKWVWVKDAFIFVSDDEALECGGDYCNDGAGFMLRTENYGFRCTVTGGTGEWRYVSPGGDIPFCEDSEIKEYGVGNAEYFVWYVGPRSDVFYESYYRIDTNGLCVNAKCVEDYEFVDQECKPEGQSANGGGDDSGASTDNSAKGSGDTVSTDDNDIETLGKLLDAETEKFERSKWRDAEGKFNTARLASDSIAAVVLGTAGGLISSKVIKKKQVENGFEDIKCTIGSQEVADWGDEFQVGIQ